MPQASVIGATRQMSCLQRQRYRGTTGAKMTIRVREVAASRRSSPSSGDADHVDADGAESDLAISLRATRDDELRLDVVRAGRAEAETSDLDRLLVRLTGLEDARSRQR